MAKATWTAADLHDATGGQVTAPFTASGVSIDSRSLEPGELFVALKDARDGHEFVEAAFEKGAAGALVSRHVGEGPQVIVDDVMAALEQMAVAARARSAAIRTAVTGSVGKTSVKEMLAQIFRAAGPAHWSEKSFNNQWGVPLTLARMPEATARAVFEVGMSTPGEIAPRSRLVRPHHALITKIAPAHLEGMGTIEAVADEKADIFAGLEAGGTIIVPQDDAFRDRLAERGRAACPTASLESFGTDSASTARLVSMESDGMTSLAEIELTGRRVRVELAAVGDHWGLNAAAALLMATLTGIAIEDAAEALRGFGPPPGRGTVATLHLPGGGTALMIDDAYNANPESMRAALSALAGRPAGRRLAALGEMLEIGEGSAHEHAGLAAPIRAAGVEEVFLAGEAMSALEDALQAGIACVRAETADSLEEKVKNSVRDRDVLLIKGSNASGMGRLADALRQWSRDVSAGVMGSGAESTARGQDAV